MSERSTRDPIEYLLNAMEHAGHADKPAEHGYADKRRSVLDAIRTLRVERDAARASLARLQQAWAENAPAVRYKQERDEAREALRDVLIVIDTDPGAHFTLDATNRARALLGKGAG